MRSFLKRCSRRIRVGWLLPLVLLALPTCGLDSSGINCCEGYGDGDPAAFDPGSEPLTSAVVCDIPQLPADSLDFPCASATDIAIGMPSTQAAVALNLGDGNSIMLDYSDAAFNQCGAGNPRRIDFSNSFPTGTAVCLNCSQQIPNKYPDPNAVCVAKCTELVTTGTGLSLSEADTFCSKNAHISTNFAKNACYDNVCTTGGMPLSPFPDPRINPENVTWVDPVNVTVNGNTITFSGAPTGDFSAGAASSELIAAGDAWVEFEAGELNVSHAIGVRTSCSDVTACHDTDGTLGDLPLVISLNSTGEVNIVENGTNIIGGPYPDYQLGERFRIHVVDRHDGSADISFTRLASPCTPGGPCTETPLTLGTGTASYPLRVDASFREPTASLVNVTIMRIK